MHGGCKSSSLQKMAPHGLTFGEPCVLFESPVIYQKDCLNIHIIKLTTSHEDVILLSCFLPCCSHNVHPFSTGNG